MVSSRFPPNHFSNLPGLYSVLTVSFNILAAPPKCASFSNLVTVIQTTEWKALMNALSITGPELSPLPPRVTQWVQQAACFCTFHTGDSALFQVQILHQESYTLFPKTDLWQTLKLPTKWYRDTIKHVIEIYIGRDTRSNLLSPHQRTSVLSFIWECTFMYEQMYLHIQGS